MNILSKDKSKKVRKKFLDKFEIKIKKPEDYLKEWAAKGRATNITNENIKKLKELVKTKHVHIGAWLSNFIPKKYETHIYFTDYLRFKKFTKIFVNLLQKQKISKIFAMPNDEWGSMPTPKQEWDTNVLELKPAELDILVKEALKTYTMQFYIFTDKLDWVVTYSHEGEIWVDGSEEFINCIKETFSDWEKYIKIL